MPKGHPKSGRLAPKKGQAYGGAKCSYESVEGLRCNQSGAYTLRWVVGGFCFEHAMQLTLERAKEPSRQVRKRESDSYSSEFGMGRAPEYV